MKVICKIIPKNLSVLHFCKRTNNIGLCFIVAVKGLDEVGEWVADSVDYVNKHGLKSKYLHVYYNNIWNQFDKQGDHHVTARINKSNHYSYQNDIYLGGWVASYLIKF